MNVTVELFRGTFRIVLLGEFWTSFEKSKKFWETLKTFLLGLFWFLHTSKEKKIWQKGVMPFEG